VPKVKRATGLLGTGLTVWCRGQRLRTILGWGMARTSNWPKLMFPLNTRWDELAFQDFLPNACLSHTAVTCGYLLLRDRCRVKHREMTKVSAFAGNICCIKRLSRFVGKAFLSSVHLESEVAASSLRQLLLPDLSFLEFTAPFLLHSSKKDLARLACPAPVSHHHNHVRFHL
jgi:hypothetical protein